MARTLPTVQGDTLVYTHAGATQSLVVGSAAWYAWLDDVAAFAFASPAGTFTARKERASSQRGGFYWYAYRKGHGKLRKVYLGRAEELTLARLNHAATTLAEATRTESERDVPPGPRPTAPSDAPHLPRRPRAAPKNMPPAHILTTKLYVPQVPAGLVLRPRLLARLEAGLSGPLTLVSAPAGFG